MLNLVIMKLFSADVGGNFSSLCLTALLASRAVTSVRLCYVSGEAGVFVKLFT